MPLDDCPDGLGQCSVQKKNKKKMYSPSNWEKGKEIVCTYTIYKFIFKHGKGQSSPTEIQIETIARCHISPAWWAWWVWYGDAHTLLAGV